MDLHYFAGSPAILALMKGKNVRLNFTKGSTYVYTVWKILFECNFCNIYWIPAKATKVNGKAGHMSDIMLVCNQFHTVQVTL